MALKTQANDSTALPIANTFTSALENRCPNRPLMRKPAKGRIGISQSCIRLVIHSRDDNAETDCASPQFPLLPLRANQKDDMAGSSAHETSQIS
jgi:hypothetical protein